MGKNKKQPGSEMIRGEMIMTLNKKLRTVTGKTHWDA